MYINKNKIGILGDIHPEVLFNFSLDVPVSVIEINIERFLENVLR